MRTTTSASATTSTAANYESLASATQAYWRVMFQWNGPRIAGKKLTVEEAINMLHWVIICPAAKKSNLIHKAAKLQEEIIHQAQVKPSTSPATTPTTTLTSTHNQPN